MSLCKSCKNNEDVATQSNKSLRAFSTLSTLGATLEHILPKYGNIREMTDSSIRTTMKGNRKCLKDDRISCSLGYSNARPYRSTIKLLATLKNTLRRC